MESTPPSHDDYPTTFDLLNLRPRWGSYDGSERMFARVPGIEGLVYCCVSKRVGPTVIGFVAVGIVDIPTGEKADESGPYIVRRVTEEGEDGDIWDKTMRALVLSPFDVACLREVNNEIISWSKSSGKPNLLVHKKSVFDEYPAFDPAFQRFPRIIVRGSSGENEHYPLTNEQAKLQMRLGHRLVLLPKRPKIFKRGDRVRVYFVVRALAQDGEPTIRGELLGICEARG